MNRGVIAWAIARPVSVSVGVILVLMFGVLSIVGIPIQLTPDITVPTISVSTAWPGATPGEVEAEILEEQETALKSLRGLARMKSEARQSSASITLELDVGSDLDDAMVRVTNLLAQVPSYPENARQPVVSTGNSSGPPIAVIVVQSNPPGRDVAEYHSWLEDNIVSQFERIPGVASIRVVGGREQEVHVNFDVDKLAAKGITVAQVASTIRSELVDISGGDIPMGKRRYVVRTALAPAIPSALEAVVISTDEAGSPITLGQVATVGFGLRKRESVGIMNGSPGLAMLFFREAGSNVLAVTQEIYRVRDRLQADYMVAEGLELDIVSDQVGYIEGALRLVRNNLIIGGILAVVVLLIFLRSVGASAIVALSIPISIIGTVFLMARMGRTVNIVSLAGMAFAVGMVVDNSIVVLENIDTWRKKEADMAKASFFATKEVWGAIMASTFTTAAVFLPIISWQDEVGELLRDVAIAVSTSVFVSLVVSVLVIPSFSARLLKARVRAEPEPEARLGTAAKSARWLLVSRWRSLATVALAIGGSAAAANWLLPPLEYLPTGNRNVIFGMVIPPPGYSTSEMEAIGKQLQSEIVPRTGEAGDKLFARSFYMGNPDSAFMGGVARDPGRIKEVESAVRGALAKVPDVFGFASQASLFGRSLGGGRSIEVDIRGSSLPDLLKVGGALFGALNKALPGSQIRPIPGLDAGAPELQVVPKRALANAQGLSSADIGLLVNAYVDGAMIGELGRAGEPKRDLVLRAKDSDSMSPALLRTSPIATPSGRLVMLADVADISETLGPTVIQRIERRRAITLQVNPPDNIALEDALAMVQTTVDDMRASGLIGPEIRIEYEGSAGQLTETKKRFGWTLLLALVITFLLLAALFEDFIAPIVILITVPLAGAGGLLGLHLVDTFLGTQPLDMMTALGFVILIGVVVNNAILIVDGSLSRIREEGMELVEAVAAAVQWRIRPILMSATTSLAGLLPLVLFPGSGSELYRGVGSVVLGGLALSTLLSIFVVPAFFTLVWTVRLRLSRQSS